MAIDYDLSLIIPVHNGEKYIEKCIYHAQKIHGIQVEIIVINDGSVDGTGKILSKLNKKYDNLVVINREKNMGVGYSRNQGIEIAKADIVGFVDADDSFSLDMHRVLAKKLLKTGSDIAICNYYEEYGDRKVNSKYTYKDGCVSRNEIIKMFFLDKVSPTVWDAVFTKKIIGDIRFNEKLKVGEDNLFTLEIFATAKKIALVNERLYYYRQSDESVMHKLSSDMNITNFKENLPKLLRKEFENEFPDEYNFWEMQLMTHSIHAIANSTNKQNYIYAKKLLDDCCNKNLLRQILYDKRFPKTLRLEMRFLYIFGSKAYLKIFPLLKIVKKLVR